MMWNNNLIIIVILALVAYVIFTMWMNESFCNCLGNGIKYESGRGGCGSSTYRNNYGWPIGTPYDSFARQTVRPNMSVCAPNTQGVNQLVCTDDQFASYKSPQPLSDCKQWTSIKKYSPPIEIIDLNVHADEDVIHAIKKNNKNSIKKNNKNSIKKNENPLNVSSYNIAPIYNSSKCSVNPDFGSSSGYMNPNISVNNVPNDELMVKNIECSYNKVYNGFRAPGRYGYGTPSGGLPSYGAPTSGCGFPLMGAGTQNCNGPAGSFGSCPPSKYGSCGAGTYNNLSIGVM